MQWVETMKDAGIKDTETYFYIQKAHSVNGIRSFIDSLTWLTNQPGNIEETLKWFDKVKTVNKTNKMAWNMLVETYAKKGYIAEAFHHLQIRKVIFSFYYTNQHPINQLPTNNFLFFL